MMQQEPTRFNINNLLDVRKDVMDFIQSTVIGEEEPKRVFFRLRGHDSYEFHFWRPGPGRFKLDLLSTANDTEVMPNVDYRDYLEIVFINYLYNHHLQLYAQERVHEYDLETMYECPETYADKPRLIARINYRTINRAYPFTSVMHLVAGESLREVTSEPFTIYLEELDAGCSFYLLIESNRLVFRRIPNEGGVSEVCTETATDLAQCFRKELVYHYKLYAGLDKAIEKAKRNMGVIPEEKEEEVIKH